MIRTRFAPSPTGELHIGGARTALFAYLFAKSQGGEFLLRIEDTDRNRYVEGSVERIIESLKWLGISPDNRKNIMVQSERLPEYKNAALKLLKENKAYICTCSKERLDGLRKEQEAKKLPTGYDGHCRSGKWKVESKKDLEEYLSKGAVVRMKMPEKGKIALSDLIRGKVEFDASLIDDQVILKSDGYPTYHLASIVDDHEMKITHVVRAEEWLSSTPKHLILYEMFGWKAPEFAHLSMILGPDKKKLSKRHGATSVMQYREEGYLPEALVNFLAFLGWNPKDERETFLMEELIKEFKLENVNKAPAIFNIEKLDDINEKYIRKVVSHQLSVVSPLLKEFGVEDISVGELELIGRGGYSTLKQAAEYILELRKEPEYDGKMLVFKKSTKGATLLGLQSAVCSLQNIEENDWNSQELQMKLGLVVERTNLTNGDVFWPIRVALSGQEKSPSPVELLVALGKEESLKRIKKAVKKLK
ncbi:MAG: glutamate--tRNA ligase [Patescibacteria group bacterium]